MSSKDDASGEVFDVVGPEPPEPDDVMVGSLNMNDYRSRDFRFFMDGAAKRDFDEWLNTEWGKGHMIIEMDFYESGKVTVTRYTGSRHPQTGEADTVVEPATPVTPPPEAVLAWVRTVTDQEGGVHPAPDPDTDPDRTTLTEGDPEPRVAEEIPSSPVLVGETVPTPVPVDEESEAWGAGMESEWDGDTYSVDVDPKDLP